MSVDFGFRSAHHTGQSDGSGPIGNDEIPGHQKASLPIQGKDRFTGVRFADDDGIGPQFSEIEGMKGLTIFQHDIVGDVHDIVDRTDSGRNQSGLHPHRTFTDPDPTDDSGVIRHAGGGIRYDPDRVSFGIFVDMRIRETEFGFQHGGHIMGNSQNGHEIAAIGSEIQIDDSIVEAESL